MEHNIRFFGQRKILVLLLVLLAISAGLNAYLFFGIIKPLQEGKGEEETSAWIRSDYYGMWRMFAIKLTPNKAVLSYSRDRQFNVSVKGLYWAPFDFGSRPFYFKIYDKIIYGGADEPPKLVGEKTVIANKSKEEMYYEILFNFTVTFDVYEIHLYTIVGAEGPNVTLTTWSCKATFAINIW